MRWLSLFVLLAALFSMPLLAQQRVVPSNRVTTQVNVREEANGNSAVVGALRPGESAEFVRSVPRWYEIRLANGQLGFVSKSWTDLVAGTATATDFEVHFLDVGTGDAAIIDMGDREIVIDGGNSVRILHDYAVETQVIDGPIELVIVTHADSDHWKGLTRLLGFDGRATESHTVQEFWEPGYDRKCRQLDSYDTFITNVLAVPNVVVQRPLESTHTPAVDNNNQLQPFTLSSLPGVTFTVLHTDATPMAGDCAYRINNASIVVMIEISGIRFLFTGDANGKERGEPGTVTPTHIEARLLNLPTGSLRADVLKVPHHGSETASSQQFIDAVNPQFVIISASTTHHFPRPAVVSRYDPNTRIVLKTDRNHASDEDHIICGRDENAAFVCNYADAFR